MKFKNIEKIICLEDKYNFLIVENLDYFYNIVDKIRYDIDSIVMFYNQNYEQLFLDKKIEVITDYFDIDCSKSKFFFDFVKSKKIFDKELIKEELNQIYLKIDDLIKKLEYESILDVNYNDEIEYEYLLKSIGVKFYNSNNRLENLINYCRLYFEIYKKEVFIFVNINMYFSEKDIILLINELGLLGIKSLFISANSNNLDKNINFNKIILDNDLCEFYN